MGKKITQLATITEVADDDLIVGVDVSDTSGSDNGTNKKFTKKVLGNGIVPVGTIVLYGGSSVPDGWLECNGNPISRNDFSELFAVIGTEYGVGDGSTTYNLPDIGTTETVLSSYIIRY